MNHKKPTHIFISLLTAGLLSILALVPAMVFASHPPLEPTGSCQVERSTCQLEDENTVEAYGKGGDNRKLDVDYYYPKNPKRDTDTYPLIVFSHGAFGIKTSNESLYLELASHGYVVCAIGHTYQSLFTRIDGNPVLMDNGYMKEVMAEDAHADKAQSCKYYRKWMKTRTGDIQFVLEHTIAQVNRINQETTANGAQGFYELIDPTKIGVMGHSLGGSAALGIGRMRDDISAVVALESPYLCDITGVSDGEFVLIDSGYPTPVMNIYTDSTWGKMSEWDQYQTNNQMLTSESDKVANVHLKGSGHFSITDLALSSPGLTRVLNGVKTTVDPTECLKEVNRITLDFFDRYLKGIS